MEFKSLKNIETSFRQLRLFGMVFLGVCALVTVFAMSICSYWLYVPSSIGIRFRKAVMCPDFVSVFILLNNVPASHMLRASFPLPLSCLIKVIFILFCLFIYQYCLSLNSCKGTILYYGIQTFPLIKTDFLLALTL